MKIQHLYLLGGLLLLVLSSGCNKKDSSTAKNVVAQKTIGILVNALDNPYYAAEAEGAKKAAEELGYATIVDSHGEDIKKQNELIDLFINMGVRAIVLDNADSKSSVASVQRAKDAGVAVALMNREIPKDGIAVVQVSHNNIQAGNEIANLFVEQMEEAGNYIELTCNQADANCVTRSEAIHSVIDQYPDMKMLARQDAKGDLLKGKNTMDSLLQAHPDVNAVITGNGPVALGAVAALKAAGRTDVVVMGIDGSDEERDSVLAGDLAATVMLQAQDVAAKAVELLDKYLETGSTGAQERILFRGVLITPKNAANVAGFSYKS